MSEQGEGSNSNPPSEKPLGRLGGYLRERRAASREKRDARETEEEEALAAYRIELRADTDAKIAKIRKSTDAAIADHQERLAQIRSPLDRGGPLPAPDSPPQSRRLLSGRKRIVAGVAAGAIALSLGVGAKIVQDSDVESQKSHEIAISGPVVDQEVLRKDFDGIVALVSEKIGDAPYENPASDGTLRAELESLSSITGDPATGVRLPELFKEKIKRKPDGTVQVTSIISFFPEYKNSDVVPLGEPDTELQKPDASVTNGPEDTITVQETYKPEVVQYGSGITTDSSTKNVVITFTIDGKTIGARPTKELSGPTCDAFATRLGYTIPTTLPGISGLRFYGNSAPDDQLTISGDGAVSVDATAPIQIGDVPTKAAVNDSLQEKVSA